MVMAKEVDLPRRRQSVPVWGCVIHRVPVWGFVIHRGDGEAVRLHPNQTAPTARVCMTHVHYPRQPRAVRQKGAAPKCSFRCRLSQRRDLSLPCCASSQIVLNSLWVRVQVMTRGGSWAGVGETDGVVRQGASPASGCPAQSLSHARAARAAWRSAWKVSATRRRGPDQEHKAREGTSCLSLVLVLAPTVRSI